MIVKRLLLAISV